MYQHPSDDYFKSIIFHLLSGV